MQYPEVFEMINLVTPFVYGLCVAYNITCIGLLFFKFYINDSFELSLFRSMSSYRCTGNKCIFVYDNTMFFRFYGTLCLGLAVIVNAIFNFYYFVYMRKRGMPNNTRYIHNVFINTFYMLMICIFVGVRDIFVMVIFMMLQVILEMLMYTQDKLAIMGVSSFKTWSVSGDGSILSPYVWTTAPLVLLWVCVLYELGTIAVNTGVMDMPIVFIVTVVVYLFGVMTRKMAQGIYLRGISSKSTGKVAVANDIHDRYESFNIMYDTYNVTVMFVAVMYIVSTYSFY